MSKKPMNGILVSNPKDVPTEPHWAILTGPWSSGVSYPDDGPRDQYPAYEVFTDEALFNTQLEKRMSESGRSVIGLKIAAVYVPKTTFEVRS